MNTTEYGEAFELQVYNFLKPLLENDDIPGASAKRSRIFFKKTYPTTSDRKIKTDVSIESYISKEKEDCGEWSTLIIFECKRYKNTVDIADLDEFESKLRKIGGYGVKGFFVTTSSFSKTSINEARKYHFGLAIFGKDGNWKWLVSRDTRRGKNEEYIRLFLGESPVGTSPLILDDGCFYNLSDALRNNGVIFPVKQKVKIPFLPKEKIKHIANQIYLDNPNIDDDIAGCLLFILFPDFHIVFENLPFGIEGQSSISEKLITLSKSLIDNTPRLRFTLAHELGHLIFHADIIALYEGNSQNKPLPLSESDLHWMDIHANKFASYILMPHSKLVSAINQIFSAYSIHPPKFIVDNQPFKAKLLQSILSSLSTTFQVSKEAMLIRLKEEGFIVDLRKQPQRLSNIFRGY